MFRLVALCLLGVFVECGLSVPLKDVYASTSVDLSPNYSNTGPQPNGPAEFLSASFQVLPDFAAGAFYTQSTTSATFQLAAKEFDPPLSQIVSVYDHTQNKAKDFLNAKPVLDQINEEDKYGNSGDKFAGVGRFVVNGIEGFSNLINKLFEAPRTGSRLIGKGVTEQLNKVGAKLVGL